MTCLVPFHGTSLETKSLGGVRPAIPSPLPEGFPPAFGDIINGCLHKSLSSQLRWCACSVVA
jgi:hypothetical protein